MSARAEKRLKNVLYFFQKDAIPHHDVTKYITILTYFFVFLPYNKAGRGNKGDILKTRVLKFFIPHILPSAQYNVNKQKKNFILYNNFINSTCKFYVIYFQFTSLYNANHMRFALINES